MSSKYKIIIFDLDGVLVDTVNMANEYFREKYPTITKEIINEALAGNFHEEMEKIKLDHASTIRTEEEQNERFAAYTAKKTLAPLFPGILELLERLQKKEYILVINTSAMEKNCLPLLEKIGVIKLFDYIGTAEVSKSKVEKFEIIKEKYSCPKENIIFITDTLGDVREAKVAGIQTIAVTWGAHDRPYFTREINENLIGVVDSVEELEQAISN